MIIIIKCYYYDTRYFNCVRHAVHIIMHTLNLFLVSSMINHHLELNLNKYGSMNTYCGFCTNYEAIY